MVEDISSTQWLFLPIDPLLVVSLSVLVLIPVLLKTLVILVLVMPLVMDSYKPQLLVVA